MSISEQTYTMNIPDMLLHAVGGIKYAGIAVLAVRLIAFCNKDSNEARVSIKSLSELFDCSMNTIRSYAKTLALLDIWHIQSFEGKGNISIWSKGSNFDTFMIITKGSNFDTLGSTQKVQTLSAKGSNFEPYIKDNIKDSKCARVHASTLTDPTLKKDKLRMRGSTPTPPLKTENLMTHDFLEFWDEFHPYPEHEVEKERCAAIWAQMGQLFKEDIIKSLRTYNARPTRYHLRARKDNPRYYLMDYVPSSLKLAKIGSVITYNQYYKFYGTTLEQDGWKMIFIPEEQRTIYKKER